MASDRGGRHQRHQVEGGAGDGIETPVGQVWGIQALEKQADRGTSDRGDRKEKTT